MTGNPYLEMNMLNQKTKASLLKAIEACRQVASTGPPQYDAVFFSLPYWDVYTPFSAVPCLIGALQEKGWRAKNVDIGIMFFHVLFYKKRRLAWALIKSKYFYREHVQPFEKNGINSYEEFLEQINWLTQDGMDLQQLREIYPALTDFQRNVLAAFYNAIWMSKRKRPNRRTLRLPQLLEDSDFAPFLEVISRFNLFPLLANLPPVVGISITSLEQLTSSCLWAHFIKILNPTVTLVAGGSSLTILKGCNLSAWEQFFDFFDYLCDGEGESCITQLVAHVCTGTPSLTDIPNLAYRIDGQAICNKDILEDINLLPPPCYEDMDLSLYLSPEPILSYQTSRGCFWGRCAFCDFDKKWRTNFRQKTVAKVIADVKYLYEKYGVNNFTFVDEAIEPKFFSKWIPELEKEDYSRYINWLAYMRVSPFYTEELVTRARRCGMTMVMLGVETFNQRLLKLIRKGISAKTSITNLKTFHKQGVKTHAWLMAGLPTQTPDEMLEDLDALRENINHIDNIVLGSFMLLPSTDMFCNPSDYQIAHMEPESQGDAYAFVSMNNGIPIDASKISLLLQEKIRPFIATKTMSSNRYFKFFDASYFAQKNICNCRQFGKKDG